VEEEVAVNQELTLRHYLARLTWRDICSHLGNVISYEAHAGNPLL